MPNEAETAPVPVGVELPKLLGLCPDHAEEFYMPLGDALYSPMQFCPVSGCRRLMVVYKRTDAP